MEGRMTDSAYSRLMNYFKGGRVHHALILSGPQREAKFQIAKQLAKALLCASSHAGSFCGSCSACRRIESEVHPDVLILREPEEETLKIDRIREISHQMEVSPIEGKAKICIVDECHRMSSGAANAFLKTLEEPPPNRYFWLLTTQPGALLPTILSRCLQFSFKPESALESASIEERASALARFEELLKTRNLSALLSALDDKGKCLFFVQSLQKALRDTLLAPAIGTAPLASLRGQSSFALLAKYEEALELEGHLRSNANYGLILESYLVRNFVPNA